MILDKQHPDSIMLPLGKFQGAQEDAPASNHLEPPFAEDHRSADALTTGVSSKGAVRSGLNFRRKTLLNTCCEMM